MCVHLCVRVPCGGEKTVCGSLFSPSTVRVLGIELRSSLGGQHLSLVSRLAGPLLGSCSSLLAVFCPLCLSGVGQHTVPAGHSGTCLLPQAPVSPL